MQEGKKERRRKLNAGKQRAIDRMSRKEGKKGRKRFKKKLEITSKAVTLLNPAALQPLPSQSWLLLSVAFDQDFHSHQTP